jgi:hypothetical protein
LLLNPNKRVNADPAKSHKPILLNPIPDQDTRVLSFNENDLNQSILLVAGHHEGGGGVEEMFRELDEGVLADGDVLEGERVPVVVRVGQHRALRQFVVADYVRDLL